MVDRPLGIRQLMQGLYPSPKLPDHWYWCRRHQHVEHSSEPDRCPAGLDSIPGHESCIRIGPFMSKYEANRLEGVAALDVVDGARVEFKPPLGMEVEK